MSPAPVKSQDIFKPMKIGAAMAIGFFAGKYAAPLGGVYASETFGGVFLVCAIAAQGLFRLFDLWRERRNRKAADAD